MSNRAGGQPSLRRSLLCLVNEGEQSVRTMMSLLRTDEPWGVTSPLIMMTDHRSPRRAAAWVAVVHTLLVVAVIAGKYLLWPESGRWAGERVLRFIDFPVLWLIDQAMQNFSLPAEWFYPHLFVALAVHESIAYAVIGGAVLRRRRGDDRVCAETAAAAWD